MRPQAQLCQHPNLFGKQDKVTLEGVTKDREREVDYVTDYGIFHSSHSSSSNKSLTFLLVCRNLPGKANLKIKKYSVSKKSL